MPSGFDHLSWRYSYEDFQHRIGVRLELFQLESFSHYEAIRSVAAEIFGSGEKPENTVVAQNANETLSMLERMTRG